MNDTAIVFEYNPFEYGSIRSRVIRDGKVESTQTYNTGSIDDIAALIVNLAYGTSIYKCELLCSPFYYNELQKIVQDAETKQYSTNQIVMELL